MLMENIPVAQHIKCESLCLLTLYHSHPFHSFKKNACEISGKVNIHQILLKPVSESIPKIFISASFAVSS